MISDFFVVARRAQPLGALYLTLFTRLGQVESANNGKNFWQNNIDIRACPIDVSHVERSTSLSALQLAPSENDHRGQLILLILM